MKKLAFVITGLLVCSTLVPAVAFADEPENPNCWGVITNQLASTEAGAVGDHAKEPPPLPEPLDRPGRAGLGNFPEMIEIGGTIFTFEHLSDFGSFLAMIDGLAATDCP